jgi:hypothetical protein
MMPPTDRSILRPHVLANLTARFHDFASNAQIIVKALSTARMPFAVDMASGR